MQFQDDDWFAAHGVDLSTRYNPADPNDASRYDVDSTDTPSNTNPTLTQGVLSRGGRFYTTAGLATMYAILPASQIPQSGGMRQLVQISADEALKLQKRIAHHQMTGNLAAAKRQGAFRSSMQEGRTAAGPHGGWGTNIRTAPGGGIVAASNDGGGVLDL